MIDGLHTCLPNSSESVIYILVRRLTVEQVEELWQCLAVRGSSECADCLYSWLLSHTKSPDQHALGVDALRFLYVEKMPTLDPEV